MTANTTTTGSENYKSARSQILSNSSPDHDIDMGNDNTLTRSPTTISRFEDENTLTGDRISTLSYDTLTLQPVTPSSAAETTGDVSVTIKDDDEVYSETTTQSGM